MSNLLTHLTSPKAILWYRRAVPQSPASVKQEFALLAAHAERLCIPPERIVRVDATGPRHSVHEQALTTLERHLAQGRITHLVVSSVDRLTRDARRRARVLHAVAQSGAVLVVGGRTVDLQDDVDRLMVGDIAAPDLPARPQPRRASGRRPKRQTLLSQLPGSVGG